MPPPHQPELFPVTTGFRPDLSLVEPRLWVRELRVYRILTPGDHNLLRRISLRPGLNILWAQPSDRSRPAQLHTPGVSGHGTGKTTFCRFLRHALGEATFGNDDQRARLRAAFPEGWIVAEVRLNAESWLVCRPFKIGSHTVTYRGRSIETLFANEDGKVSFDEYIGALDVTLTEPFPVATFATTPTPIAWTHLLQWLARDQESRFTALADFRHPSSDSLAPDMAVEDRHFLFRAVLQLIDTGEQAELENNKALLARRQQAEKTAPLFRFRGESALKRQHNQFPEFRADLEGANWLNAVTTEWTSRANAADRDLKRLEAPDSLRTVRDQLLRAQSALHTATQRRLETSDTIEWIEQQISVLRGESNGSQLDEFIRRKFTPDRFCGQPLSTAIEWECPLARGRMLPIEKRPEPHAAPTVPQMEKRLGIERARLEREEVLVAQAQTSVAEANATLQEENEAFDRVRRNLAEQSATSGSIAAEAQRAFLDQDEAEKLEALLVELDKKIRKSQEIQTALREQSSATLSAFADTFARIAHAVLGDEVDGSIRFRGRQIRPTLIHGIDLTSAAFETLKIICFDLAALINSVEGRGMHPRFLLHDGPREADMDADLYQRIFLLVAELETAFAGRPLSFQYILTTTEPPPKELQTEPWLLRPVLDATIPIHKYLGEDF